MEEMLLNEAFPTAFTRAMQFKHLKVRSREASKAFELAARIAKDLKIDVEFSCDFYGDSHE